MAKKPVRPIFGFGYKTPTKVSTSKKTTSSKKTTPSKKTTTKKTTPKTTSSFTSAATGGSVADWRRAEEASMAPYRAAAQQPLYDERVKYQQMQGITPTASAFMPSATLTQGSGVRQAASTGGSVSTGSTAAGVPSPVAIARQQYDADRAAAAATRYANEAAIREVFSQGLMGARGGAADIYGGRAPALLGQAVTGTQRDFLINQAAEELRNQAALEALRRAYSEAVGSAYQGLGDTALDRANQRSAIAAQINRLGMG